MYEFYLRANPLGHDLATWEVARDLYLQCVRDDPHYAPAWARLGRVYRVLGKYQSTAENLSLAESAFNRALALNPELSMADSYYAQLELDLGRAEEAMVRLIRRATSRSSNPELFAALVSACRYCGLLEPSFAAHERAHRLDPNVRTSVQHTFFMAGDYLRAAVESERRWEAGNMGGLALLCAGHPDADRMMKADVARYDKTARADVPWLAIDGRSCAGASVVDELVASFPDPEGHFYHLLMLATGRLGSRRRAPGDVVDRGFFPYETFARHRWLDIATRKPGWRLWTRVGRRCSALKARRSRLPPEG